MSWFDWYVPLVIGGIFLILGVLAILWGRHEESSYYDAIAVGLFCVIFAIVWIFV